MFPIPILGPLLFLLYINDLTGRVSAGSGLFAFIVRVPSVNKAYVCAEMVLSKPKS